MDGNKPVISVTLTPGMEQRLRDAAYGRNRIDKSMSAIVERALDVFLPPVEESARKGRARTTQTRSAASA